MSIEKRIAELEKFSHRTIRCPSCRRRVAMVGVDDDGKIHCGICGAELPPGMVLGTVKSFSLDVVMEDR